MHSVHPIRWLRLTGALLLLFLGGALPGEAEAIPPFARRHEMACSGCHQGHYPRLNAFGRQFRDNGYQVVGGAEPAARAARSVQPAGADELAIFKELPLAMRGEFFTVAPAAPDQTEQPAVSHSLFAFLIGGGTIARDVSYLFTWTPFPDPSLHQARIGLHNLFGERLGEGTVNLRAGSLFLLDFQRPGHRFLSAGADDIESITVGNNGFNFADANLGVELYGRPGWGPFHYELALVQGDAPENQEKDDWKDLFARTSATLFQYTNHELTPGIFAYKGRSETTSTLGGLVLAQRDDFWIAGGDLELDLGRFNLSGLGLASRHGDPAYDGRPQSYQGGRAELLWVPVNPLTCSVRYEQVWSANEALRRQNLAPHLTLLLQQNVLLTGVWRQNLSDPAQSSALAVLDTTF